MRNASFSSPHLHAAIDLHTTCVRASQRHARLPMYRKSWFLMLRLPETFEAKQTQSSTQQRTATQECEMRLIGAFRDCNWASQQLPQGDTLPMLISCEIGLRLRR